MRICDLLRESSFTVANQVLRGLRESCPSLGHGLWDSHTTHSAHTTRGSHDVKEIALSFSELTCPKEWHVPAPSPSKLGEHRHFSLLEQSPAELDHS